MCIRDSSLGRKLLCVWICALLLAGSVCLVAARRKIMRLKEQMGRSDRMLEEEQLRATGMELEKKRQELQALQSQINPHFLYNTLDTFRGLAIEGGDRQLADMLGALSAMFKYLSLIHIFRGAHLLLYAPGDFTNHNRPRPRHCLYD